MTARKSDLLHLLDRLPPVRGRISGDAPLAPHTWFRVGGPAEVLFRPADADDLAPVLAALPAETPLTVLGVASNLLVRDGGVPGLVVQLRRGFADIRIDGDRVIAGAGCLDLNVALTARDAGLTGLEFLSGIPGTIGGAVRMNAGAYGREVVDAIESVVALDRQGNRQVLDRAALGLTYRHSELPADWTVIEATFACTPGDAAEIGARIDEIQTQRADTQPVRARTGGSTFANPPGEKAWELIDQAGCRGLMIGGAQVSEKHCNFLINTGNATAADLEKLGETVRALVKTDTGIDLRWEIKRIGVPA